MPWEYGMDYDKSRWKSVSKNLKRAGYKILGDDGEYLYWAKWKRESLFKKKDPLKSLEEIKEMLVSNYMRCRSKMNKCARCEILTDNDFGEDSKLWVEVKGHKGHNTVKYARYLCDECAIYMINALEKFIKVRR